MGGQPGSQFPRLRPTRSPDQTRVGRGAALRGLDATGRPGMTAATATSASVSDRELQIATAIELVWMSEAHRLYQVQWTRSLDPPQWMNVGPVVLGSDTQLSVFDSTRDHPQGFYRVQILP